MKTYFVTGCAGFIGFHVSRRLLSEGYSIVGADNLNDYYDVNLKQDRLKILKNHKNFYFYQTNLENFAAVEKVMQDHPVHTVIHLAAQPGVRYSISHPQTYINSNIVGFFNVLEACRQHQAAHLIYASSSSVYGANTKMPYSIDTNVDHPMSLYAATKKANELMAHTYSNLYGLPTTGLRFFTVYGPWGRPDMAIYLFVNSIIAGKPIKVFNYGKMRRDFTFIDDIVEGITMIINKIPQPNPYWDGKQPDPSSSFVPYKIYNIGHNQPVELLTLISIIEDNLGRKAKKEFLPIQPGDVPETYANIDSLMKDVGFKPQISIEKGVERFVAWYKNYHNISL